MKYWYQKVNPHLNKYLRTILVVDNNSNAETSDLPIFTTGLPALLCKTETNSIQITLIGQFVPNDNWTVENDTTLIVFFFKPFVIGSIFKLSAKELRDKPVELNLWSTQKTMALNLQLIHSKSTEEKVEILNHFILTQVKANQRECEIIQYATDKLIQNSNPDILSQLLKELHLTERTFQRVFKKYVGITANEYRRICQFYFAFSQLKGRHFDKLTDVAYTNGYFDQSHYIRSFKEFTETTPNEYLQFGLPQKKE